MRRRAVLVRIDVLKQRVASIIRVKRIYLPVTANVFPSLLIRFTPMKETTRSSETSALTTAIHRPIQEEGILRK
jgi:hypothetical protein